jgi:tRNA(Ile)-lysidine synthase
VRALESSDAMREIRDPVFEVRRWIQSHELPRRGEVVLCAISGGSDSTALAWVLATLSSEIGFRLILAHCNHHLRGSDSDRDEAFVAHLASTIGVPCVTLDGRLSGRRGNSVEAEARSIRRRLLRDAAAAHGARRIALGHTRDDQAETVLLRAVLGTSLRGLGAMRAVDRSATWLRPALNLRREALRAWLRQEAHTWVEDRSNAQGRFLRNRLRSEVLPLLAARMSPRVVEALSGLSRDARETEAYLAARTALAWRRAIAKDMPGLEIRLVTSRVRSYDPVIRKRLFRMAFVRAGGDPSQLTRKHLDRLCHASDRSGCASLPSGVRVVADSDLVFLRESVGPTSGAFEEQFDQPVETTALRGRAEGFDLPWAGLRLDLHVRERRTDDPMAADGRGVAVFDIDEIGPLAIRNWHCADRFQPFGMAGRQKLSDFFVNEKIPRRLRSRIPLLADAQGILWIVGRRRSARAPVTERTRWVLEGRVSGLSGGSGLTNGESADDAS